MTTTDLHSVIATIATSDTFDAADDAHGFLAHAVWVTGESVHIEEMSGNLHISGAVTTDGGPVDAGHYAADALGLTVGDFLWLTHPDRTVAEMLAVIRDDERDARAALADADNYLGSLYVTEEDYLEARYARDALAADHAEIIGG